MKFIAMALIAIGFLIITATSVYSYMTPVATMPQTFESHEEIAHALSVVEMRRTRLRLETWGIIGFIVFSGIGVVLEVFRRLDALEKNHSPDSKQ